MSERRWKHARIARRNIGCGPALHPDPAELHPYVRHPAKRPRHRHMFSCWDVFRPGVELHPALARVASWFDAFGGIPF